jgi:prepilin-type N-terminal cleavage/methylation domain-containing protein
MKSEDGFTLVEVLVSFAILSILLITTSGAFTDGLRRLSITEETRSRLDQAAQLLAQIESGGGLAAVPGFRVTRQRLTTDQFQHASVLVRIFDGDATEPLLETIVVEGIE